jgi:hypothetical protein
MKAFRSGMRTIVSASAAPYGYTITVWSSGAVLIHAHGTPTVGDVFLFLAGALLGFGFVGLLAQGPLSTAGAIDRRHDRVLAGMLDWAAVGAAVGSVALLAQIHSGVAWPLGAFSATVIFLVVSAIQLAVSAVGHRPGRDR